MKPGAVAASHKIASYCFGRVVDERNTHADSMNVAIMSNVTHALLIKGISLPAISRHSIRAFALLFVCNDMLAE